MASQCAECSVPFSWWSGGKVCEVSLGGCGRTLCSTCRSYAVAPASEESKGLDAEVHLYCKTCFQPNSLLDFSKKIDIVGGDRGSAPSVIFLHGGGGCRSMFAEHALALSSTYRCVLLDLPGHGSRMDEPLTMASALATLKAVVDEESDAVKGQKPVLIGGSLGGYISMEFLGLYPTLVSGAVVCMAGQCVGVGRGCAAALGIRMMNVVIPNLSEAQLLKGLISEARKNGHMSTESVLKMSLRTGMFFHQALAQTDILSSTNSAEALSHFRGPILFINGSRDHRDSENLWLDSVQTEGAVKSKLIVYEGADHFFSHDTRFEQRLIDDMKGFLSEVFARKP